MHSLFGTKHLVLIAMSVILIVALFILSKKLKFKDVCKIMFYVGLVSETVKIFYYIIQNEGTHGGILPKTDLPFHLCSIQIIFISIVNFANNEKLKRVLLAFMYPSCLLGGIAALLIATNSSLNGTWVITSQYFLYHIAIVVLALNICTNKELKLQVSDYFNCLKFLVGLMFFAVYINSMFYDGVSNINFMYVASPPQSGLPYLNENHGWLVYIIHYAILVVACVTACYVNPILTAIKKKLKTKTNTTETSMDNETSEIEKEAANAQS